MSKTYGTRFRIPYLHLRPEGFVWRRRLPRHLITRQLVLQDGSDPIRPDDPNRSGHDQSTWLANLSRQSNVILRPLSQERAITEVSFGEPSLCPSISSRMPRGHHNATEPENPRNADKPITNESNQDSNHKPKLPKSRNSLNPQEVSICISLRTRRIEEAVDLTRQITILSNQVFTQARMMKIHVKETENLLIAFGRVLVETADIGRAIAGPRSVPAAELAFNSELALQEVLLQSFRLRDYSIFQEPLAKLAEKLGISMPQDGSDDAKLIAYEAARIAYDASKERIRRDHGIFPTASPYFAQAMASELRHFPGAPNARETMGHLDF